jgi:hypothetical protein
MSDSHLGPLAYLSPKEPVFMKRRTALIVALAMGATPLFADQKVDHYAAEESADLAEAMAKFSEFNKRMAAIVAMPSLSRDDIENVHQLTYTLEDALGKIIEEATELAELLESVHLASESSNVERLKARAASYLTIAQQLTP